MTAFLERNDLAWREKSCNIAIIQPEKNEAGWGALRIEIKVGSVSGLIRLRKVFKKQVEVAGLPTQSVWTRNADAVTLRLLKNRAQVTPCILFMPCALRCMPGWVLAGRTHLAAAP